MRICFFGDSFVNGTGDDDCRGWPGCLCAEARQRGCDVTLYNLGIRRDTSGDVARRWEHEASARLLPEHDGRLVFSFGVNDCVYEQGLPRVSENASVANTRTILARARARWPTLMVGPPCTGDAALDQRVGGLSDRMEFVCRELSIPFLPIFPRLGSSEVWRREAEQGDGKPAAPAERKQILRLVVREVVLDQKRTPGQIWMRIIWQTGTSSEHLLQRRVHSYAACASADQLERRVRELNADGRMDYEVAQVLNAEQIMSARGMPFRGETVHLLRKQWGIRTAKINGVDPNPPRWPDGSYSVQGAAEALGVTAQTVFKWLRRGRLVGRQLAKAQPWQISITDEQITALRAPTQRNSPSNMEAS